MNNKKELSINVAEKPEFQECGDELDFWYHAYLVLLDERNEVPRVLQEIHFHPVDLGRMQPSVRIKNKDLDTEGNITVFKYLSGDESEILNKWNNALEHALKIKESTDIKFGLDYRHEPKSNNCRTGVKAMLDAMGIGFRKEFTKSSAGTETSLNLAIEPPSGKVNENSSIETLWHKNNEMIKFLPPPPKSDDLQRGRQRLLDFDFS
jgi:hypothetical protein